MNADELVIGSRGSALALAQATLVCDALRRVGRDSRVAVIETAGDRRAPDTAWGEGAFVAAIERALLDGEIDVAVHSAKDVPTDEDPRLRIAAYLTRADPRDALVVRPDATARRLDDLPRGARVGTDSPRRTGFLLARRPDLVVQPLHGNVDTRLRRLDAGEVDALVLACAGLDRLGLGARIAERIDPEIVPPAPGQGAIAVQVRADDDRIIGLAGVDDAPTRLAVESERAFLAAAGGGCRAPIGALATIRGEELDLLGGHARPDGSATTIAHGRGPVTTGTAIAAGLSAEMGWTRSRTERRVLVTRAVDAADELIAALHVAGVAAALVPAIAIELETGSSEVAAAARRLDRYAWVVVTSANGAKALLGAVEGMEAPFAGARFAVVGAATRTVLEAAGVSVAFQPSRASASVIAIELPRALAPGDRVLIVRGDLADETVATSLRKAGVEVDDVIGYRTVEAPASSRQLLRSAFAGAPIDAVLFTSGSTVRGLVALAAAESQDVVSLPAICIGPETATAAERAGFRVVATAEDRNVGALARVTASVLAQQLEMVR